MINPRTFEQETHTIVREVTVPKGRVCQDYSALQVPRKERLAFSELSNKTRCDFISARTVQIGPNEGLGTGGSHTYYVCSAYHTELTLKVGDGIYKCRECLKGGKDWKGLA